jgi:hypothetical protein
MARIRPEAQIHTTINGHTLTGIRFGGRWSFVCNSWPDLAANYDGTSDATACLDEFERRATSGQRDTKEKT